MSPLSIALSINVNNQPAGEGCNERKRWDLPVAHTFLFVELGASADVDLRVDVEVELGSLEGEDLGELVEDYAHGGVVVRDGEVVPMVRVDVLAEGGNDWAAAPQLHFHYHAPPCDGDRDVVVLRRLPARVEQRRVVKPRLQPNKS